MRCGENGQVFAALAHEVTKVKDFTTIVEQRLSERFSYEAFIATPIPKQFRLLDVKFEDELSGAA